RGRNQELPVAPPARRSKPTCATVKECCSPLVGEHGIRARHGGTPSPRRGEGWGEGVRPYRKSRTPHPTPLPSGEGASRSRGSVVPKSHSFSLNAFRPIAFNAT